MLTLNHGQLLLAPTSPQSSMMPEDTTTTEMADLWQSTLNWQPTDEQQYQRLYMTDPVQQPSDEFNPYH